MVQVGDFGVWPGEEGAAYLDAIQASCESTGTLLLFLDGNHDDLDQLSAAPRQDSGVAQVRPRIWHLPRALRWTWHGLRFAALGGATSLDVRDRTPHASWWPQEALRPHQHEQLRLGGDLDILLTHDAPAGSQVPGLSDGWPPAALEHANTHRERLQESVQAVRPKLVVHGHLHVRYTDRLASGTAVEGLDCDGSTYSKSVLVLDLLNAAAVLDPISLPHPSSALPR